MLDQTDYTHRSTESGQPEERDEIAEVKNLSRDDTRRIRRWRLIVTGVLLVTAFAVTCTTYGILKRDQKRNFESAVRYRLQ